jgi:hypothetical protein
VYFLYLGIKFIILCNNQIKLEKHFLHQNMDIQWEINT